MSLNEVYCHGSIMKTMQEGMCAADLIAPCRVRGVRTGPGNFSMTLYPMQNVILEDRTLIERGKQGTIRSVWICLLDGDQFP